MEARLFYQAQKTLLILNNLLEIRDLNKYEKNGIKFVTNDKK